MNTWAQEENRRKNVRTSDKQRERERKRKSKSSNDTHKPCHYTILIAGEIHSMNFCACKMPPSLSSARRCFSFSVLRSLFHLIAHSPLFPFHFFTYVCIAVPCFFFLVLVSVFDQFYTRFGCLLLQHERDAIFVPYVFAHLSKHIQWTFFSLSFLKKRNNSTRI